MRSVRPVRRTSDELHDQIPRLRRFARLLTVGDAAAADDLVQETLLRAIGSVDRWRGDAALGSWLTAILMNVHRSERRRAAVRQAHLDRQPREGLSEPPRQEQRMELKEALEALEALPEEQRAAIALVAVGNMTYAEAASSLGVKLGTLMSRISRGRAAMRRRLEGEAQSRLEAEEWPTKRSA